MKDIIKYGDIIDTDSTNGVNVCISIWAQDNGYCNEQTSDFNAGTEINVNKFIDIIIEKVGANNIIINFSILGGEPLCDENIEYISHKISEIREKYRNIIISVWSIDTYENIHKKIVFNESYKILLDNIDILIDEPYIESERNSTLLLRGSSNQRVININKMRKLNEWNFPIVFDKGIDVTRELNL